MLKHEDVLKNINQDDVHCPRTALVALENTSNRGGGVCYSNDELIEIKNVCVQNKIPLHLDGARIFNALVEKKQSPKSYGKIFDSISICLSKGLGAPVGSLLIGNKQFINRARRVRKVFGGGMRQAGIIAAGGIYALENNIDRLVDDHKRARIIANAAKECSWIQNVVPVETNIIVCYMKNDKSNTAFINKLEELGIKCIPFGEGRVRMVTHLDISDMDVDQVCKKLNF